MELTLHVQNKDELKAFIAQWDLLYEDTILNREGDSTYYRALHSLGQYLGTTRSVFPLWLRIDEDNSVSHQPLGEDNAGSYYDFTTITLEIFLHPEEYPEYFI